MNQSTNKKTLVVIVGPTGSGKTDLSISLARHFNTEIISTDSRQVYIGMPIGTAQPSPNELDEVKHHFIASKEIFDNYTCGKYESEALATLETLFKVHDIVIAVGGSGLYINALCSGMDSMPDADPELRDELNRQLTNDGLEVLMARLEELDSQYAAAVDRANPQRVIRALEVCIQTGKPYSDMRKGGVAQRDFNIVKIGIDMPRAVLYERINRRVDIMMADGLEQEARQLYPHRELNSLQTVGYRELFEYFDGKCSREDAVELIKRNSRRYAKRQMTWFGRDKSIAWFQVQDIEEIKNHVKNLHNTLN